MKIDTIHPEYTFHHKVWELCRDCYLGEMQVKHKGVQYLPKLSAMNEEGYKAYLNRAVYYPVISNTISGRLGQIMRKSPNLYGSDRGIKWLQDSVTKDSKDISVFVGKVLEELMKVGRVGVLTDYDEKRQQPYFSLYHAEAIYNWLEDDGHLVEVHLGEEVYVVNEIDEVEAERRLRRCFLDESGNYTVELYRVGDTRHGNHQELLGTYTPMQFGAPLKEIPFTFMNPNSLLSEIEKPPLLDIALISLAVYRNSSDLEQILHTLAMPTPYGTGMEEEDLEGDFVIGPSEFKLIRSPDAKLGMLEFTGSGIEAVMQSMSNKFSHIVSIGGDASFDTNRQAENAETFRLRMAKETSAMSNIVLYAEKGINQMLKFAGGWISPNEEMSLKINRDFLDAQMSADLLKAINEAVVMGLISRKAAFDIRLRNEIYPEGWTFEQEEALLEDDDLPDRMTTSMAGAVTMAPNPAREEAVEDDR